MDISFNFFGSEGDIEPIVYLTRLETLLLYGNPVLGPTGEDPMFVYIEDVVDKANQHRDEIQSTISYIDVCVHCACSLFSLFNKILIIA